jgi:hypothetical protein
VASLVAERVPDDVCLEEQLCAFEEEIRTRLCCLEESTSIRLLPMQEQVEILRNEFDRLRDFLTALESRCESMSSNWEAFEQLGKSIGCLKYEVRRLKCQWSPPSDRWIQSIEDRLMMIESCSATVSASENQVCSASADFEARLQEVETTIAAVGDLMPLAMRFGSLSEEVKRLESTVHRIMPTEESLEAVDSISSLTKSVRCLKHELRKMKSSERNERNERNEQNERNERSVQEARNGGMRKDFASESTERILGSDISVYESRARKSIDGRCEGIEEEQLNDDMTTIIESEEVDIRTTRTLSCQVTRICRGYERRDEFGESESVGRAREGEMSIICSGGLCDSNESLYL